MPDNSKSQVIVDVCGALRQGDSSSAAAIIRRDYPFRTAVRFSRRYSRKVSTSVYIEAGCIDRYSGERLVFPGTLLLLSQLLPDEIPYQINCQVQKTLMAYWELDPTVDHVLPMARGGFDERCNDATTSMIRNSAKGHWTLEELGWTLHPTGDFGSWDGLLGWFLEYVSVQPEVLNNKTIKSWHRAAREVLDR